MSESRLTKADEIYLGRVNYVKYHNSTGRAGLRAQQMFVHEFGAVEAKDPNGVCAAVTTTAAGNLTIGGALATGGVATLTTPRNVSITSTANESGDTFTITGTDVYGEAVTEDIAGPNATIARGKKAFKTITQVAVDGALTSTAIDVGTDDSLGLPVRLADLGKLIAFTADGLDGSASSTVTAGLASTGTSTATTADIRGTIKPATAPNASVRFSALVVPDGNRSKVKVFGATQA
jgi:hypothetical protein